MSSVAIEKMDDVDPSEPRCGDCCRGRFAADGLRLVAAAAAAAAAAATEGATANAAAGK